MIDAVFHAAAVLVGMNFVYLVLCLAVGRNAPRRSQLFLAHHSYWLSGVWAGLAMTLAAGYPYADEDDRGAAAAVALCAAVVALLFWRHGFLMLGKEAPGGPQES